MICRIEIKQPGDSTPWLSVESGSPALAWSTARKMADDSSEVAIFRLTDKREEQLCVKLGGKTFIRDDSLLTSLFL